MRFGNSVGNKVIRKLKNALQLKRLYELSVLGLILYVIGTFCATNRYSRIARLIFSRLGAAKKLSPTFAALLGRTFYWSFSDPLSATEYFKRAGRADTLDENDISLVLLSAAYAKNLEMLRQVHDAEINASLKYYASALIDFAEGRSNWVELFGESLSHYLARNGKSIDPELVLPVHLSYSSNIVRHVLDESSEIIPYYERVFESPFADHTEPFVLVSLDTKFMQVFSEFLVQRLRRIRTNQFHFAVVTSSPAEDEGIAERVGSLGRKYGNISFSILRTRQNVGLVSSLSRFSEVKGMMDRYGQTAIVVDADSNLGAADVMKIEKDMGSSYDCAFVMRQNYVMWALYNAGVCIFRNTTKTREMLGKVHQYYARALHEQRARWTLDQTGLFFGVRGVDGLKVLDLDPLLGKGQLSTLPPKYYRQKIRAKALNLSPQ